MTDNNHPITPPQELVREWARPGSLNGRDLYIADQAARWGADQELEAVCEWLNVQKLAKHERMVPYLRAIRRPKPPSLKEQAQRILVENGTTLDGRMELDPDDIAIIRRALESMPDEQ